MKLKNHFWSLINFCQVNVVTICLLLTTSPMPLHAEEATTINAADIQKELDNADAGTDSQKQNLVQTTQSQSGDGLRFGGQIDGFSLNYLIFLSQYIAGSAMPVLCRSSMAGTNITGTSLALPYLNIDNIIYALSSLIYLFVEILSFERIQKLKADMDQKITDLQNPAPGSGSSEGKGLEQNPNNLQLMAIKLQRDMLAEQIRILYFKEDAIRATKAGWLLSALVSTVSYVIWYTGAAAASLSLYMAPFLLSGGAGAVAIGGAAAATTTVATVGITAGVVGAGVGAGVAIGGASSGQSPLTSIGMGLLSGSAVPGLASASMATVMGMPDLCAPFSVLAAGTAAGAWFNDNFFQIQQQIRQGQEAINSNKRRSSTWPMQDFKTYVLPKIAKSKSSHELATALIESQLMQKGALQNMPIQLGVFIQTQVATTIAAEDVQMIKTALNGYYREGLKGIVSTLFPTVQASSGNETGLPGISENSSSSSAMPPPSSGTPAPMEDPLTGFKNDVNSVINTGNNLSELSKHSDYLKDISTAKDAGELISATVGKFLTFDFIKKFAAWMGFKNGGEILLFFFLSSVIDLGILPFRAVVLAPPIPITAYAGFFPGRIINSLVGAFFAHGYYSEVYEYRGKLEVSLGKLDALIAELEAKSGNGPNTNISGNKGSSSSSLSKGSTISGDNSELNQQCINGGELNPGAIGPCSDTKSEIDVGKNFESPAFQQVINLPEVGGTTALGDLSAGFNNLSLGDTKAARASLQSLGTQANAISKRIKNVILSANEKLPDAKVSETLSAITKDQIQLLREGFKMAGVNFDQQAKLSPYSNMAAAGNANENDKKNASNQDVASLLKQKNITIPAPSINSWSNKPGTAAVPEDKQFASYTEKDLTDSLRQNYEYDQGDAINPNAEKDIFKAITIRYFKTAYPQLLKKKKAIK